MCKEKTTLAQCVLQVLNLWKLAFWWKVRVASILFCHSTLCIVVILTLGNSHWSAWQAPDLMSLTCRQWYVTELLLIWIQLLIKVVRDIIPIQEILFLWDPHVKGDLESIRRLITVGNNLHSLASLKIAVVVSQLCNILTELLPRSCSLSYRLYCC